jgi:hypothetical protein
VGAHANKLFPQLSFCEDPNDKNRGSMSHDNEKNYTAYREKPNEKLFMAADHISELGQQQLRMANTLKGWYDQHCLATVASYLGGSHTNLLPRGTVKFDSAIHTYSEMPGLGEHTDAKPGNYDPAIPGHDLESFTSATIGFSPPTEECWRYLEFFHEGEKCNPIVPLRARYMHVMLPGLNGLGMTHKVRAKRVPQYNTTPWKF